MKQALWIVIIVFLVVGLVACNGKEESSTSSTSSTSSNKTSSPPPVSQGIVKGDLVSTLSQETPTKGRLNFIYTIKNQTESIQTLEFNSGKKFDYLVKNENGEVVYQYGKEMMFTQALTEEELKQGAELRFNLSVKESLKKGTYQLEAWLTSNRDNDYKKTIPFEIK